MYISGVKDNKLIFRAVRTPDTDTETTVCRISSEAAEIIAKIRKETRLDGLQGRKCYDTLRR